MGFVGGAFPLDMAAVATPAKLSAGVRASQSRIFRRSRVALVPYRPPAGL